LLALQDLDPVACLSDLAARDDRLLCLATHGRDAVTSSLVGGVARGVARRAEQPLVLVGPAVTPIDDRIDSIVVGFDPGARNDRLLRVAGGWARQLDAQVHLVAVEQPGHWLLVGSEPVGFPLDALLARAAADPCLDGLRTRTSVLRVGRPATVLADVAARERCMVAVTAGPGGHHRLGPVPSRLARRASVPVLVVPDLGA
jgi:nucleotide-binding universal stress UspA family protein